MRSLPSSRKLIKPILVIFILVALLRLCLQFGNVTRLDFVHHVILSTSIKKAYRPKFNSTVRKYGSLQERFLSQYQAQVNHREPDAHVIDRLSKCGHLRNPHTNHIRLLDTDILNISMVPSSSDAESWQFKNNQYFNPAIIPLPSYTQAAPGKCYHYLLVSRLVTSGLHQESHLCFADICLPSPSSPKHRECEPDDLELLGDNGGMRCITTPEKVNIPPTPAKRCSGAWKVFPDIPGFHDPRIFWSGRGEPLIEVNSGSTYGCVGLWLQDLRVIYPLLDEILKRRPKITERIDERQSSKADTWESTVDTRQSYSKVTELTRNPRRSREEIEKNWILFFPSENEMLVQYDVFGKAPVAQLRKHSKQNVQMSNEVPVMTTDDGIFNVSLQPSENDGSDKILQEIGLEKSNADLQLPDGDQLPTSQVMTAQHVRRVESLRETFPNHIASIHRGRTISRLLSHGLATLNLTSPLEQPCVDVADHWHVHDAMNNTGHWHQGSNSLRLIFCTRSQFYSKSCITQLAHSAPRDISKLSWRQYEALLLEQGAVLHFSIIHRKFSNDWDLPMRYERYLLVWEARVPYKILAISEYPIVFGTERVRPWTFAEDVGWDRSNRPSSSNASEMEQQIDESLIEGAAAYFTYTPSLAWSWSPQDENQAIHRERGHEDRGTGFLDDEVVIGIGMDDISQGLVQVRIEELLGCMRICGGLAS